MTVAAPSSRSWMQHKEEGKIRFQQESYQNALTSYRAALNASNCPAAEQQILLSNIVACRLKIGGPAMAAAAVEEAKQCIALNDRWAKGHIRLASVYVALGDHSNDACNSLQRAISLDPSNQTARQMLTRELRRDSPEPPPPSAPPQEFDDSQHRRRTNNNGAGPTPADTTIDHDVETLSIMDRIRFYWMRTVMWYQAQSEDVKTLLKVAVGIIVLYIMMGGRFGFEGSRQNSARGDYGPGSAYDRYGASTQSQQAYTPPKGAGNSHSNDHASNSQGGGRYQRRANTYNDDQAYNSRGSNGGSQSFHFPNLFDGSVPSMICLAGIAYVAHLNGINPFQALMMMNMMGGGRRRGMGGMGGGMGMGGMGMAGMGYGMARNAGMFGGRQRGARPRGY